MARPGTHNEKLCRRIRNLPIVSSQQHSRLRYETEPTVDGIEDLVQVCCNRVSAQKCRLSKRVWRTVRDQPVSRPLREEGDSNHDAESSPVSASLYEREPSDVGNGAIGFDGLTNLLELVLNERMMPVHQDISSSLAHHTMSHTCRRFRGSVRGP